MTPVIQQSVRFRRTPQALTKARPFYRCAGSDIQSI